MVEKYIEGFFFGEKKNNMQNQISFKTTQNNAHLAIKFYAFSSQTIPNS